MIYFIQTADNQFTKIGIADDPLKRIAQLQTGIPYTLKLFALAMGGRSEEHQMHERFAHLNTRGEWFRTTPELTTYAAQHLDALEMSCWHPDIEARRFFEVAFYERRLLGLYAQGAAIQDDNSTDSFCANAAWYGYGRYAGLKPMLTRLVGWEAEVDRLEVRTSFAYSAAYQTIYNTLPGCRNCICA